MSDDRDIEAAALLAAAVSFTEQQRAAADAVVTAAQSRSRVVARLLELGVRLSVIERVTGASRAALTRHVRST